MAGGADRGGAAERRGGGAFQNRLETCENTQPIKSQYITLSTNHVRALRVSGDPGTGFKLGGRGRWRAGGVRRPCAAAAAPEPAINVQEEEEEEGTATYS